MKAMISQPMAGKTDGQIEGDRNRAIAELEGRGYEVVNTSFTDEWYSEPCMKERGVVNIPLCYLAKSSSTCASSTPSTSSMAGKRRADAGSSTMPQSPMA